MKEVFKKIIERLEEERERALIFSHTESGMVRAIKIVREVEREYKAEVTINATGCREYCANTEKCEECCRYTYHYADIDWYEEMAPYKPEEEKQTGEVWQENVMKRFTRTN